MSNTDDESILSLLAGKRIFVVEKTGGGFVFTERCDDYFTVTLTRDQVLRLADELRQLAEGSENAGGH